MSIKVYVKKGAKNYKENRLVKKIEEALAKQIEKNPDLVKEFTPANNFAQLQNLYDKYVVEDAPYEDVPNEDYEKHKEFRDAAAESAEKNSDKQVEPKTNTSAMDNDNDTFIDPLNREEPIVRDYVMSEEFESTKPNKQAQRTSFDEPTNFKDSFEIPDENDDSSTDGDIQKPKAKKEKTPSEPVNPHFDEMSSGKKRKSTRKFAKYIVETVCMLSEKGFTWYANKDINDAKLAEYELNNEMDLSLLVTLEEGQQMTVKQFFQMQCMRAEQLAKIEPEEKSDLADALAEVLLEKGVGPTPTQELLLISLKIFGGQIVNLITLKSQTNSLLAQLRAMKEEQPQQSRSSYTSSPTPPPVNQPEPISQQDIEQVDSVNEIDEEKEMMEYERKFEDLEREVNNDDLGIIETSIETKE